jgi:hypothetical protein
MFEIERTAANTDQDRHCGQFCGMPSPRQTNSKRPACRKSRRLFSETFRAGIGYSDMGRRLWVSWRLRQPAMHAVPSVHYHQFRSADRDPEVEKVWNASSVVQRETVALFVRWPVGTHEIAGSASRKFPGQAPKDFDGKILGQRPAGNQVLNRRGYLGAVVHRGCPEPIAQDRCRIRALTSLRLQETSTASVPGILRQLVDVADRNSRLLCFLYLEAAVLSLLDAFQYLAAELNTHF